MGTIIRVHVSITPRGRSRTGGLSLPETGASSGSTPFPLTNPSRSFPFKGSSEPGRTPGCRVSKPALVEKNSLKGGTRRFNPGETGTNPDPSRVRAGMGQAFTIVPGSLPFQTDRFLLSRRSFQPGRRLGSMGTNLVVGSGRGIRCA
eukprot:scaffold2639_cov361-Pavlova_lutheri.AAC.47